MADILGVLTPEECLHLGLGFLNIVCEGKKRHQLVVKFHKHYGSSPEDLACQWSDLLEHRIISHKDNTTKGFQYFLRAHYFLWTYEKNAELLASRWGICERYSRGEPLWFWIRKIAELSSRVIYWPESFNDEDTAIFLISADGVDFKVWEKKHPVYNVDKKQFSKKFAHGALKYIIAISVHSAQVVFFDGPFPGGKGDLDCFREKLKELMLEACRGGSKKKAILDRGFRSSKKEEAAMFSLPDTTDSAELHSFKSRGRLRHETLNGRLKFFRIMSDTFKHGDEKHKIAFTAVITTVQYQMNNGSPIFAV